MRGHRAFTLIELLVVIAVIALLMAILVPVLRQVRNQARAVACQANLGQWGKTLALYLDDNEGRLPFVGGSGAGLWFVRGAFLRGDDPNEPDDTLYGFHTKDIACCPMAVKPFEDREEVVPLDVVASIWWKKYFARGTAGSTFRAWEITEPPPPFRGSYGFNEHLFWKDARGRTIALQWGYNDIYAFRHRARTPCFWMPQNLGRGPSPAGARHVRRKTHSDTTCRSFA